jgi:hypothetical protein
MDSDCACENPEACRDCTNLRVSKWWSLLRTGVFENARAAAWRIVDGAARRDAQAFRANAAVAVERDGSCCGLCCCAKVVEAGRIELAVQDSRGTRLREIISTEEDTMGVEPMLRRRRSGSGRAEDVAAGGADLPQGFGLPRVMPVQQQARRIKLVNLLSLLLPAILHSLQCSTFL